MKLASIPHLTKYIFNLAKNRRRGWQSLLYNSVMMKYKKTGPLMMPVHVSIEPSNTCNALCPVCETGKNEMTRKKGRLDIDQYKNLIDEIWPTTSTLMYYFMGEPFLNKHAYEMIRYARDKKIYVETCTNGDLVDPEGVIYSDINSISFQLGGMDQETHHRYRVNTDLNKAHEKLYKLIELRNKTPNSNVMIEVGFIVMRHNEHQVGEFLKWAQDIGVDKACIVDPCVRNMLEAHAYLPKNRKYWFYDEDAYNAGILKPKIIPQNECQWIWHSIQLNWNGDAVPCCRDPLGKHVFGNVFEEGLKKVWNGEKARKFRQMILTKQNKIGICKLCSGYSLPELKETKKVQMKESELV